MNLLALLALVVLPAVAGQPKARIELIDQVEVTEGIVLLGQVARLHSEDLALMRQLVVLPVGRVPRAGTSAVLQRDGLVPWVRRQIGEAANGFDWSGALETQVSRIAGQVKGEDIARAALDAVNARLLAERRAETARVRLSPRDISLPAGNVRLEVRGLEQGLWNLYPLLWIDVWAGQALVRTVPVPVELSGGLEMGQRLGAAPLQRPGRSETERDAGREPFAVARGDWANLRSVAGSITLESRVEVLQDGRPGQKVRVRQQGATGPVIARVVGLGLLELAP